MTQWLDVSLLSCDSDAVLDKSEIRSQKSEGRQDGMTNDLPLRGMTNVQLPMIRPRSKAATARQAREMQMIKFQAALSNIRQVLECVREAPLLSAPARRHIRKRLTRAKAVSPLRFATALQDAGARTGHALGLKPAFPKAPARQRFGTGCNGL